MVMEWCEGRLLRRIIDEGRIHGRDHAPRGARCQRARLYREPATQVRRARTRAR
jgi:hypothetical protein